MLSRALVACLLALSLCGCGAAASPATGVVTGHVQIRACGGAYRPEQTGCPARATLTFQLIDRSSASTTTTDSSGAYRIDLKPGSYIVQVMEGSAKRALAGPRTVTVVAGKTVTADFIYTIQLL